MKNYWKIPNNNISNNRFRNNNNLIQEEDDIPNIISLEKISNNLSPQGNKIYFYSDINVDTILSLNRQIDDLTKQFKILQFTYGLETPPHIEIHIYSEGGDVFAALNAADKIKTNPAPIHTYCEGLAASAATLISCVGNKRFMSKNSCILIHAVSTQFWGNYEQAKDEKENLDLIMRIIKNTYLEKTKFKAKELDELLKHDLYLDSTECLKKGLVDFVI